MSSARSRLAVAVVAVALLAGCEHDDMKPPIAVHTIAVLPTLTAAQTRGLVSVPWSPQQTAAAGDSLLALVPAAACPRLRGAVVTETPTDVTVQIFATLSPCSDRPGGVIPAPVHLSGPLGTRRLHHGPVMPAGAVIGTAPPAR
ncbi:MAG TPA: hypothetical protein VGD29_00660 [Actinoplanes sp.]|jgi:hypothetical protein